MAAVPKTVRVRPVRVRAPPSLRSTWVPTQLVDGAWLITRYRAVQFRGHLPRRCSSVAERRIHNPVVGGSTPPSATMARSSVWRRAALLYGVRHRFKSGRAHGSLIQRQKAGLLIRRLRVRVPGDPLTVRPRFDPEPACYPAAVRCSRQAASAVITAAIRMMSIMTPDSGRKP